MLITMSRDQFITLFEPAMKLVGHEDDAKIYVSATRKGGMMVKARAADGKLYEQVFPAGDESPLMRSSWYSPAWLLDMFDDIKLADGADCNIEIDETGLRITVRYDSDHLVQYAIHTHVCKTVLMSNSHVSF